MELKNAQSTSWPFKLDEVHPYAFWKNAFSKEECLKIIKIGKKIKTQNGITLNGDKDYRKSNVSWMFPDQESQWFYRKLTGIIEELNNKYFKFNIFGLDRKSVV
jgi:hypothetical protein